MAGGRRRGGSNRQRHGVAVKADREHELRQAEASEMDSLKPTRHTERCGPRREPSEAYPGIVKPRVDRYGKLVPRNAGRAGVQTRTARRTRPKKSRCLGGVVEVTGQADRWAVSAQRSASKRSHAKARCSTPGLRLGPKRQTIGRECAGGRAGSLRATYLRGSSIDRPSHQPLDRGASASPSAWGVGGCQQWTAYAGDVATGAASAAQHRDLATGARPIGASCGSRAKAGVDRCTGCGRRRTLRTVQRCGEIHAAQGERTTATNAARPA